MGKSEALNHYLRDYQMIREFEVIETADFLNLRSFHTDCYVSAVWDGSLTRQEHSYEPEKKSNG